MLPGPTRVRTQRETDMLKIFVAVVLVTSIYAGPVSARGGGGGGAEPMPLTNFTDMPSYQPRPVKRPICKHACKPLRWHQSSYRGN